MVFRRFSVKIPQDAPRSSQDAPGRPQDVPRRPQEAPKTPQDGPGAPQDAPRRPQDEAQGEPGAEKIGPDLGSKSDLQRTPLQSSMFERLGMDFGKFFGVVIDFSWILRVISQVRKARLISRSWLAADPVVARASREAAQLAAVGHVRKVRLIPRIISQLARTKQNDREHHSLTA